MQIIIGTDYFMFLFQDTHHKSLIISLGHTYNMKISFKPNGKVTAMKAKLYGVIAGIPVPFPLPVQ